MTALVDLLLATATPPSKFWAYAGFLALVAMFLALDLGVFHRKAHVVSMREAIAWSIVWLCCGLGFAGFVWQAYDAHWFGLGLGTPMYASAEAVAAGSGLITTGTVSGADAASQYLVAYLVEKSLAMDNIFVIALVFAFFAIPAKYQHRVLFWGILGALVLRGGMIFLGAEMIVRHQWILIVFGGFLLLTALKMALIRGNDDPAQNVVERWAKRLGRVVAYHDGQRFFTRRTEKPEYAVDAATGEPVQLPARPGTLSNRWAITPLFLALILVEFTDLVFAVDSIPAVFAITPDPFLVLTSNIFAILGLRSLYFCLAALIARFRFLKPALILILAFVGVKLLLLSVPPYLDVLGLQPRNPVKVDTTLSLLVVLGTIAAAVLLSWALPAARRAEPVTRGG
ncbi:MAG: TerC/Alx family metal homeostasis membrane protein [Planctomycetes bacterium]|nr:TerC/Alx family metal homeostasis membrane protein [Planctomycetota bacterium]